MAIESKWHNGPGHRLVKSEYPGSRIKQELVSRGCVMDERLFVTLQLRPIKWNQLSSAEYKTKIHFLADQGMRCSQTYCT